MSICDLTELPWAIFTDSEIDYVGLTEAQAREKHNGVQTCKVDIATDRFITDSKTGGFLKIGLDSDYRILGATGIGATAGEWVQCLTLAVKQGLKAEELADTIFAYPTYTEIVNNPAHDYCVHCSNSPAVYPVRAIFCML